MQDINYLDELFYSSEVWGYLGILALCFLVYAATKKNKALGILCYVVIGIMGVQYLQMITASGYYSLHAVLLFVGGFIAVIGGLYEN